MKKTKRRRTTRLQVKNQSKQDFMDEFEVFPTIESVGDLIDLGNRYCNYLSIQIDKYEKPYTDNTLEKILAMLPALRDLDAMIGLAEIKKNIVEQILYYLQHGTSDDLLNTKITGPPGTGKTSIAKIIADIYVSLGILDFGHVVFAHRKDLIGKWCGHTANKTTDMVKQALGGVLVIDEAYALGNEEQRDVFTKECIDTLNQLLSEYAGQFACIICGYKDKLDSCFFAYNDGLRRRFPWSYNISEYSAKDLTAIFRKMINEKNWSIDATEDFLNSFFSSNFKHFQFFGGSVATFLSKCQIVQSKRTFSGRIKNKQIVEMDIIAALHLHQSNEQVDDEPPQHMYI